jgi:perosamine synthetase
MSMLPMFEAQPANKVSYDIYRRAMNLPSYHDVSDAELARVVAIIRKHLRA